MVFYFCPFLFSKEVETYKKATKGDSSKEKENVTDKFIHNVLYLGRKTDISTQV